MLADGTQRSAYRPALVPFLLLSLSAGSLALPVRSPYLSSLRCWDRTTSSWVVLHEGTRHKSDAWEHTTGREKEALPPGPRRSLARAFSHLDQAIQRLENYGEWWRMGNRKTSQGMLIPGRSQAASLIGSICENYNKDGMS